MMVISPLAAFAAPPEIGPSIISSPTSASRLPSALANSGETVALAITTDPGSKIGFWIEQANNPGFTTWTVDEANITRVQHAVVTADSTSQQMIIGFEDKWVGDLPSTKKVWGADLDFNDCLVSISVAPADSGSPPQGQPAPSIICTLVAGIIAIGSVGWRNIF